MQISGRRAIVRTPPSKHCGIQEPGQSVRRRTHAFEEIVSLGDAAHRFENLSEAMIDFLVDPLESPEGICQTSMLARNTIGNADQSDSPGQANGELASLPQSSARPRHASPV
jgi:hypothetical protein